MQSTRIIQISLVLVTCGLIVFLFFNGRNNASALVNSSKISEPNAAIAPTAPSASFDFTLLAKDVNDKLAPKDAEAISNLKETAEKTEKASDYKAVAEKYEALKQPALAGYYYKEAAQKKPEDEKLWFGAGKNFFEAQQLVEDSASYAYFVEESSKALTKVLEINPSNLEAKADQAVNYIEGKGETMTGIGMLKEIVQVDPDNRRAIFFLGILSMQSNQMDKAVERFEKLISLGPDVKDNNYPFYYRYLGQAYLATGNKAKARSAFMRYKTMAEMMSDPHIIKEADQLLHATE